MLKSVRLITLLSIFFMAFIAKANVGITVPLPQATQFSKVIQSKIYVPICYMETANGTILDLSSLCKKSSNSSMLSNPPSPSPYNYSLMKKFDEELYGEGN